MIKRIEREEILGPGWIELREDRVDLSRRWSIRAAQWRALELARTVFGEEASASLGSLPPRGPFSGLLHLAVPFENIEDHRSREARFAALAGSDELLRTVPLVFVFEPDPVRAVSSR